MGAGLGMLEKSARWRTGGGQGEVPEPEGVGNRMRAAPLCPDLGNQAAAVAPGETG